MSSDRASDDSWDRAKNLLLGAVDVMLQLKETKKEPSSSSQALPPTHSSNQKSTFRPSVYDEHRRLFGYQPSKTYSVASRRTKGGGGGKGKGKKKATATWTKEVVCLKECAQETAPNAEEKMELAKLNLGTKKLVFNAEGNANHIHEIITDEFPILEECGGYTLMRVSENSRDLVAIEGPDGDVTIPFLKDILRQAKLYVRPLQCNIPEDRLKQLNKEAKGVIS